MHTARRTEMRWGPQPVCGRPGGHAYHYMLTHTEPRVCPGYYVWFTYHRHGTSGRPCHTSWGVRFAKPCDPWFACMRCCCEAVGKVAWDAERRREAVRVYVCLLVDVDGDNVVSGCERWVRRRGTRHILIVPCVASGAVSSHIHWPHRQAKESMRRRREEVRGRRGGMHGREEMGDEAYHTDLFILSRPLFPKASCLLLLLGPSPRHQTSGLISCCLFCLPCQAYVLCVAITSLFISFWLTCSWIQWWILSFSSLSLSFLLSRSLSLLILCMKTRETNMAF